MVDCVSEKMLQKLMGRKEIEDALLRLDALTNQGGLMIVARNLEVTHRVNGVVRDVDSNVKATKVLTDDVDDNVKVNILHGMQHYFSFFAHIPTPLLIMSNTVTHEIRRLSLLKLPNFCIRKEQCISFAR